MTLGICCTICCTGRKANIFTGCGAMSVARTDNLSTLWFILIIASLGIGGIVVPASIMTTIICPDVSTISLKNY